MRINSVSSGLAEADLETILQSQVLPSSLMLPKVEGPEEIRWVSHSALLCTQGQLRSQSPGEGLDAIGLEMHTHSSHNSSWTEQLLVMCPGFSQSHKKKKETGREEEKWG